MSTQMGIADGFSSVVFESLTSFDYGPPTQQPNGAHFRSLVLFLPAPPRVEAPPKTQKKTVAIVVTNDKRKEKLRHARRWGLTRYGRFEGT